ncbi:MAG: 4Fe-4S dicluster domain-containing protein [Deltaproteobacteria bacterium]|jgi:DMSO reductase family type II enzyme iron-sulfur subunit
MPVPKLEKSELIKSKHQIGLVMDLNKCIGCQTCTVACKTAWTSHNGQTQMYWMNVETHPGKGYPKDVFAYKGGWSDGKAEPGKLHEENDYGTEYDYDFKKVLFEGGAEYLTPSEEPTWGVNWDEDQGKENFPSTYYFYLPRLCNHCTHPACLEACPRNALYKREKDGIVLLSQERCHGYRFCVQACPYQKVYWNHVSQVSQKCIFCFPRIDQGIANACSTQCVGQVRFVGMVDDPDGPIHKLVHHWKVALPLLPQGGTKPNIYYVPPTSPEAVDENGGLTGKSRIPAKYLEGLFGAAVHQALDTLNQELGKLRRGETSQLMTLLNVMDYMDLFSLPEKPDNRHWFGAFAPPGTSPKVAPGEGN